MNQSLYAASSPESSAHCRSWGPSSTNCRMSRKYCLKRRQNRRESSSRPNTASMKRTHTARATIPAFSPSARPSSRGPAASAGAASGATRSRKKSYSKGPSVRRTVTRRSTMQMRTGSWSQSSSSSKMRPFSRKWRRNHLHPGMWHWNWPLSTSTHFFICWDSSSTPAPAAAVACASVSVTNRALILRRLKQWSSSRGSSYTDRGSNRKLLLMVYRNRKYPLSNNSRSRRNSPFSDQTSS
mmetsp:Transcript_1189/g.3142  ORF Transcript_1189/g.3142 Transcript_1189/m.3142 type:complete len:240 (-) Transcript_1189:1191-1910(-)